MIFVGTSSRFTWGFIFRNINFIALKIPVVNPLTFLHTTNLWGSLHFCDWLDAIHLFLWSPLPWHVYCSWWISALSQREAFTKTQNSDLKDIFFFLHRFKNHLCFTGSTKHSWKYQYLWSIHGTCITVNRKYCFTWDKTIFVLTNHDVTDIITIYFLIFYFATNHLYIDSCSQTASL